MSHPVKDPVSWLYPPIEPTRTGMLKVSDVHELYWEESGNPKGKPVGVPPRRPRRRLGPEGAPLLPPGQVPHRALRPARLRQEHAVREPRGEHDVGPRLRHREAPRAPRDRTWQVFGGSWGSTLALAYAEKHPDRVTSSSCAASSCSARRRSTGSTRRARSILFPDAWEPYLAHIPEGSAAISSRRTTSVSRATTRRCVSRPRRSGAAGKARRRSSCRTPRSSGHYEEDEFALAFARIEAHYFVNEGFFEWTASSCATRARSATSPASSSRGATTSSARSSAPGRSTARGPRRTLVVSPDAGHSAWEPPNTRGARRRDGQVRLRDLRAFLDALRKENDLAVVEAEADPRLEIPEIHRRVIEEGGPALLFTRPKGSPFPVVTNLFGTEKRLELAFGKRPSDFVKTAARAATELLPPTPRSSGGSARSSASALRVGTRRAERPPVTEVVDDRPT